MPGFDGTGPRGLGPMTGGGRGFCNPYSRGMGSPYMGYPYGRPYGWGRGMGRGFGMGRGMGRRFGGQMPFPPGAWMSPFGHPMTLEEEAQSLKDHAQMLKEELNQIDNRISELERAD